MDIPNSPNQLSRWGRFGLFLLIPLIVGFGVVVEIRGALLQNRWTDLTVFLRAAWAVKHGEDLYQVTDTKGLHYHYPPLLAIALMPFADPPAGTEAAGTVPFPISVALWYIFSVAAMAFGIHTLARALEKNSQVLKERSRPGNSVWWALRVWPFLACLPTIGHALSLGQVNILWLALLCMMGAALMRGRSWQAGLWLAGAICLKVLPFFLLIYPLWRRDTRCLAACMLGLVFGLVIIPSAVLGPERTLGYGQEWMEMVLLPAIGVGSDRSRADELIEVTATQNQALSAIIHNTLFVDWKRRPSQIAPVVRLFAWALGILLTTIALFAAGWRIGWSARSNLLLLAALNVNMLLLAPVGHPHYLVLLVPLMMGVMVHEWEREPFALVGGKVPWLLAVNFTAVALPLVPDWVELFNIGLPMYAALGLWLAGIVALWQIRQPDVAAAPPPLGFSAPTEQPLISPLEKESGDSLAPGRISTAVP